ncbi:hypothetical protein L596_011320 [Steinernema carpocapsae]|uniref:FecR protein domain-containing protein n=1 Tax=Steinernema carpocapsae TaxID=34508 RepID=A0A4U5NU15_STECR|nr:hypothetical protein L596_011320 [Steinernema carpocapsae]
MHRPLISLLLFMALVPGIFAWTMSWSRNGFRTAQYGKVRIRQKGEFYQSLSSPDATILIETQSLTVKSNLGLHFFLSFCGEIVVLRRS